MALLPDRIVTDRLVLERWSEAALDEFVEAVVASFPELTRWMSWALETPTDEAMRAVLERFDAEFDADRAWQYLMREPDGGVVGGAGLVRNDEPGVCGIGYWVRTERTSRGYATTASLALTEAGTTFVPDLIQIEIHMDQANYASAAIPPKLGYRLDREINREIVTAGHTGRGYVWVLDVRASDHPPG